jgi:formylglycine-generating enzyme required for sulfatase activity
MYATKAGSIASDGQGIRNSPFSTAFLKHVKTPGLDVNLLPSKITKTVGELTKGLQVPGTYMQLNESFTFVPAMTPDEEKTLKTSQLTGLKAQDALMVQKEAEMERKKKEDDAALAKKQAEIDALDKQIADLKTKTASGNSSTAETDLDKMLLYVEQKEAQKKQLEVLQKQAEDRRIASEKELYNMKLGQYKAKDTEINTNLEKYYKIAASEFGKDMAQAAWDGVLAKYGIAKGTISRGDEYSLKSQANPEPEPEGVMAGGGSIVVGAVFVKGGTFTMGSSESNDEKPMHTVTLGNFIMMKYEVTFAQYDAFCDATGNTKPSDQGWGRGNRPVINVSWNDATAYAQWLSQKTGKNWRLPTEAEWEYAARGGSAGSASAALYSGSSNIDEVAWYSANSDSQTQPVGQKRPNALGLCDMTGNVWEWCQDWYGSSYYSSSLTNNPQGPSSGTNRVCRGGSCTDNASFCRAANRTCDAPDDRINTLGFRLVSPK